MKNLVLVLVFFSFSCQKIETELSSKTPLKPDMSQIEEIEASGIKLFKEEIWVYDSDKKNSLLMRIASASQELIALEKTQIFELETNKKFDVNEKLNTSIINDIQEISNNPHETVYHEILETKFLDTPSSYTINVKAPMIKQKAKISGYSYSSTWETPVNPTSIKVTWLYTPNSNNGILAKFIYKELGITPWRDAKQSLLHSSYPSDEYPNNNVRRLGATVLSNWANFSVTHKM